MCNHPECHILRNKIPVNEWEARKIWMIDHPDVADPTKWSYIANKTIKEKAQEDNKKLEEEIKNSQA